MPKILNVRTFSDSRGSLSVIENDLGFAIRRIFYIYDVTQPRGGHGHLCTTTGLICLHGAVKITGTNNEGDFEFFLSAPNQCLLLDPADWHEMHFEKESLLLALASTEYHAEDYVFTRPRPPA